MTREEFMLQRLKDDARTNRITYPILLGCTVVFIILSICSFFFKGPAAGVGTTLVMSTIALRLPFMKRQRDTFDGAIRELEAHIADPSVPLSDDTKFAISSSDFPARELLKGWIALAVTATVLVTAGIFFLIISEIERGLLIGCGVGCIIGGSIVYIPAMRMYHSWKIARDLERAGL